MFFGIQYIILYNMMILLSQISGDGNIEEQFLHGTEESWYRFKLECYNFRLSNKIPMVTRKKIAIEYVNRNK